MSLFSVKLSKHLRPPASASASASTCKMLGQMLKSWNLSLSVFFLAFNLAYHTNKVRSGQFTQKFILSNFQGKF